MPLGYALMLGHSINFQRQVQPAALFRPGARLQRHQWTGIVCETLPRDPFLEAEYWMATPPVFDIGPLVTPVSDAQPAGPELRSATGKDGELFYAVRDARRKAADAERRLREFALLTDDEREAEPSAPDQADWDAVCRLALDALTRSKDLWITAWLIEGLIRRHGFAGLRDGFGLAHQLCQGFSKDIHPQDLPTRFAQLAGLNGTESDGTLITASAQG